MEPLLDIVEGVLVGDIVDDDDTVGTTVVGGGDGTETLLTGGIPLDGGERAKRHTIWSLTVLPSISTVLILKSTPMVVM